MYKSRTLKCEKCNCGCDKSPLKNIIKKFSNKTKKTIREKDVFENGCNKKLFICDHEPEKNRKKKNKKINVFY